MIFSLSASFPVCSLRRVVLNAANALANEQAHVLVYQVKRLASAAAGTALYASLWAVQTYCNGANQLMPEACS
jgi:hypothetical protein